MLLQSIFPGALPRAIEFRPVGARITDSIPKQPLVLDEMNLPIGN